MALNGSEKGATAFLIGSGPQLNNLTHDQLAALASRPTIGVNRTQYAVDLKYFLSAYPSQVILALMRRSPRTTIIHLRPKFEPPLIRHTLTIRRMRHRLGQPLKPSLVAPEPTLLTFKNVALAATHFALVLGAARVVFVGVEQNNALHFYDMRPAIQNQIAEDINRIRAKSVFTTDHPYASPDRLLEKLAVPPEELANQDFYVESHKGRFSDFFDEMRRNGVEVYATTPDSVVAAAGAEVIGLDEALTW
jgi:hypothetical protein